MQTERGTFIGALAFGLACGLIGVFLFRGDYIAYKAATPATGVVIRSTDRYADKGETVTDYVVQWKDAEGTVREFTGVAEHGGMPVGKKVNFRYDPRDPDRRVSISYRFFVGWAFGLLSAMGFLFAYQVRRRVLRQQAAAAR